MFLLHEAIGAGALPWLRLHTERTLDKLCHEMLLLRLQLQYLPDEVMLVVGLRQHCYHDPHQFHQLVALLELRDLQQVDVLTVDGLRQVSLVKCL